MKKIWPWVGLLLLLMILCIWTKIDTIHLTKKTTPLTASIPTVIHNQRHPIEFDIVQKAKGYQLSGLFRDTRQQQSLVDRFSENARTLAIGNTSTNQTLAAEEVIILVEEITPHFIQHYKDGRIRFHDSVLSIEGTVDSYAAKHKMQALLNRSSLRTQDNAQVILPKKPISFFISNENGKLLLEGKFNNTQQSNALLRTLPQGMHPGKITQNGQYVDSQNAVKTVQKILPCFADKYTKGRIVYNDETLTVEGLAKDQAALDELDTLLQNTPLKVINHTRIDPQTQKARLAALEAEKAAQEAAKAEAKRRAEEAAAKEAAAKEASEKARLEMLQKEAQKAKQLALAQEQAKAEAEAAKKNIAKLLKVENIEFEVAKGTLTPKGRETVNKLAEILKTYPHIKAEIAGYTDSDGSAEFNQKLSQARVDSVKKALIEQGIDARRLQAKGYGEANPLLPNTTDENKQANRRVEIYILGE